MKNFYGKVKNNSVSAEHRKKKISAFDTGSKGSTEEDILLFSRSAVLAVERKEATLDDLLDLPQHRNLRRTLSHLLLGYFKHKKAIDAALAQFIRKAPAPETHALLKVSLAQALTQERMAPQAVVNVAVEVAKKERNQGFVNAVLRKSLSLLQQNGLPSAPEEVLPDALLRRWKKEFSSEVVGQLTDAFLSTPDFTFRIEKQLMPETFEYQESFSLCSMFPFAAAKPADVLNSEEFKSGTLYIQDPAASLAVSMAPEENFANILDLCAAPGGKSLMLLEKYPHVKKFIAFDRSSKRQELTRRNFELRQIKHLATDDKNLIEENWDLILVDAPCSNTGVFRRRPDALWRFSAQELQKAAAMQRELLEFSAAHLSVGGCILYSTCSIEEQEDELQVQNFLKRYSNFVCVDMKKLLPCQEHDGAFCAVLKKQG